MEPSIQLLLHNPNLPIGTCVKTIPISSITQIENHEDYIVGVCGAERKGYICDNNFEEFCKEISPYKPNLKLFSPSPTNGWELQEES